VNAQAMLAGLLGISVEELAEPPVVAAAPALSAEPVALASRPRLRLAPRLVVEFGVSRWYDDAIGHEVNVDGTPLAG
jgi:hypothetical protein